jgi:DNA-binding Lrp family transcriptional regulator
MAKQANYTKILMILLKNFLIQQTVTSLADVVKISRVGMWKVLKKLESDKLVILTPIGKGKTSAYGIKLNWDNLLLEKTLSLAISQEAMSNQRWLDTFAELESKVDFLVVYGSILTSPKDAGDIDILSVVSDKNNFVEIDNLLGKVQLSQAKKIHAINYTVNEFRNLVSKKHAASVDAIKKGIVLFGQDKFIQFVKGVPNG